MSEPYSAEWYREFAEEVRHNGKTVSQYNHYLGIAEAISIYQGKLRAERDNARGTAQYIRDAYLLAAGAHPESVIFPWEKEEAQS